MSSYIDLDTVQIPADSTASLALWGAQVAENSSALWGLLAQSWKPWLNATPSIVTVVGDSQREGYYHHLGYTITGMWSMRFDGATIGAGTVQIGLPQPYVAGPIRTIGTFVLRDASVGQRHGGIVVAASTSATTTADLWWSGGALSNSSPVTITDDDVLMVNVFYESGTAGGITVGTLGEGFGELFGGDFGS